MWAKDKSNFIFGGEIARWVDPASFQILTDSRLGYDKNGVYYGVWTIPNADHETITILDLNKLNGTDILTLEDKDHFYEIRLNFKGSLQTFSKQDSLQAVFDYANSSGIFTRISDQLNTTPVSIKIIARWELAVIASRLVMGVPEYNVSNISSSDQKEKLDLVYNDVPENKPWNKSILKGMYYANKYNVMGGDEGSIPTKFRATDNATGLDLTKIIYSVLKNDDESFDSFLTRMKSSGVFSNFDPSDSGFIEFPFFYENDLTGPVDTFRINFKQDALYEDAGILLQSLMMKKQINLVEVEEGQD